MIKIFNRQSKIKPRLDPDEVFLDSHNLPLFNTQQFEGQIERPIAKFSFRILSTFFLLILFIFFVKLTSLQIFDGEVYAQRSANNTLRHIPVFYERGIISDRLGVELAWNEPARRYITEPGFGHLLGYIAYPTQAELDSNDYHQKEFLGRDGVEQVYNLQLAGERGLKIEEVDAVGKIQSEYILEPPKTGKGLSLSIDARLQQELYRQIFDLVDQGPFTGGAGVIMDINTGELLTMVSVPEYDPNVLSFSRDRVQIEDYINDPRQPFLNRALQGRYAPGSIIKPFLALAALEENIISPDKKILSTGSISIPNPFASGGATIFRDWRAHGWVNMREAIAVSSNVYFYNIGGGYQDQKGLGISNISRYARLFGFGQATGINFTGEALGTVPDPEWKAKNFNNEPWRLGNTYHTSIGQYGFEVTPLQVVRAVGAIASSGHLVTPTIIKADSNFSPAKKTIPGIDPEYYQIVREGMRMTVTDGSATSLNSAPVHVALKTGTAELGVANQFINAWATGFFPYEEPRYSFAIVLERGSRNNPTGAVPILRRFLDWLAVEAPEYITVDGDIETLDSSS